jgi:hypothetical protein
MLRFSIVSRYRIDIGYSNRRKLVLMRRVITLNTLIRYPQSISDIRSNTGLVDLK